MSLVMTALWASAVLLSCAWLLTPREATRRSETLFRAPIDAEPLPDARRWRHGEGGVLEASDSRSGTVLDRFMETRRREATASVEWRSTKVRGLVLAPRLFGYTLFDLRWTRGTQGQSTHVYLRPLPR